MDHRIGFRKILNLIVIYSIHLVLLNGPFPCLRVSYEVLCTIYWERKMAFTYSKQFIFISFTIFHMYFRILYTVASINCACNQFINQQEMLYT